MIKYILLGWVEVSLEGNEASKWAGENLWTSLPLKVCFTSKSAFFTKWFKILRTLVAYNILYQTQAYFDIFQQSAFFIALMHCNTLEENANLILNNRTLRKSYISYHEILQITSWNWD